MRITNKINNSKTYRYKQEDSSDVIENDEYVGEIIPKNKIIIKNYKNNTHSTNNPPDQNGIIIEERNNYQFYVSGDGYATNNIQKNQNSNNLFGNQKLNYNKSKKLVYDELNVNRGLNNNNYDCNLSKKKEINNIHEYSNFENEKYGDDENYTLYNHKYTFGFRNVGIIKDSSNGQLYKIYEAIPIDINNENIEQQLRNNKNYLIKNLKSAYGNRNNFVIDSIDINKKEKNNYISENPLIKKENNPKNIKNKSDNYEILPTNQKIKSVYIKKDSISSKIFKNNDTSPKIDYKSSKYNLNEKELYNENKINNNNNNYIEI